MSDEITIYLLSLSLAVGVGYPILVALLYGVQKSISDSFYIDRVGHWFTLYCWSFPLLTLVAVIEDAPLMFPACVGIMLVGAAAEFRVKHIGVVHYVAAVLGVTLAFVALMVHYELVVGLGLTAIMVIVTLYYALLRIPKRVWWIEVWAILLIYIGLILNYII